MTHQAAELKGQGGEQSNAVTAAVHKLLPALPTTGHES